MRPSIVRLLLAAALVLTSGCECSDPNPRDQDGALPDGALADGALPGCEVGVDDDFDGLDNATECALGTDPRTADSDGDGLNDGLEVHYPRICVASDPADQVRPPPSCETDSDCSGGSCVGLDPRNPDSDGDGVPDGQEDSNGDGTIDPSRGETDPRLIDTDGDGTPDNEEGVAVCRPDGLVMPAVHPVPGGGVQVALDNEWGPPRNLPTTGGIGMVFDDATSEVAAFALERDASGDISAESGSVESAISSALGGGVTPVLVGRSSTTHDGHAARTSFYRVASSNTAAALRDLAATALAGGAPDASAESWRTVSELYLEITTLLNETTSRITVLAAFAPSDAFDDPARETSIRVRDLTNATGVAASGRTLGFNCEMWVTESDPRADFLWLVDTSGSMSDDQQRLGNVAGRFFSTLTEAGVDFRVGIFEASQSSVNFEAVQAGAGWPMGFQFIEGTDPNGVQELQYRVTYNAYESGDAYRPFDLGNSQEEPVAAGVRVIEEFERYASEGSTDPNRTLRPDTQIVTFFVTDEPGTNDDSRFFNRDTARWGSTPEARIMGATEFFTSRDVLTFGMVSDYGNACPHQQDFPKCTILGGGGAFIPITTATDDEVRIAMDRIVEAVAGAASRYVFSRVPISATIRVALDGVDVPRSRADGFDYDGAANSIVFRGSTYRPMIGSEVVVSYRIWGSGVE